MRALPPLGLACLLFGTTTISCSAPAAMDREAHQSARNEFVGAWRLASLEEEGADGSLHKAACTGLLAFTDSGDMSVQVMYSGTDAVAAAGSVQYAQGGYEASFRGS